MTSPSATAPEASKAEQRREMIAIAAYYLAEGRGFAPGGAEQDWLRAELLIDSMLAERWLAETQSEAERSERIRNALKLSTGSPSGSETA
jgi:hypothetical protein